ncbi:MAG TPA: DMT family transporter [Armatimonadota bacterium]|nr:DMT family transporter [Armatimonadota bacterium]
MTAADLRRLFLLAALWGGSFIFIRIAVPVLGPVGVAAARVLIAGAALLLYAAATGARLELRARWGQYLVIGVLNSAVPFVLIGAAEVHLSASMAAILNATSPLFGALLAALFLGEPLTGRKTAGMVVAVAGVVVLVGWTPLAPGAGPLLGIAGSLLAAAFYGLAGVYTKARVKDAPPLGMAVGSQLAAGLLLAPLLPFAPPAAVPSAAVLLCVLALALLSTALAYLLYFRLVVEVGPARALTVTFLVPVFGVLWGALFLREPLTLSKLLACAVILGGTVLATGAVGRQRERRG